MELTILGNCGPYPGPGKACSGYLLKHGSTKILIDCGNGTLGRLQQKISSFEELDMIILTHLHSDHISDAMVLRYALGIGKMKGTIKNSIPLYAPGSPKEDFDKLQFQEAFKLMEIKEDLKLTMGELEIRFKKMEHPVECYGITVKADNKKFVYTADTRYCDQVFQISQDADVLLCECGVLERDKTETTAHLSAREAGAIGQKSNVKKLLLTHFWPGYDLSEVYEEAKESFGREVMLVEEMQSYTI